LSELFSVVIPTYRRPEVLLRVLEALARQIDPPSFEVVVIDDGSDDGTVARLGAYHPSYAFRFATQPNSGPAAARNAGVRLARGSTILFLGDDTVPEPPLLAVHAAAHGERRPYPAAVLGYTTWPADRRVSPFLEQINEYGLQFGYSLIRDPESVPFNFFYTSNISLPRSLLLDAGLFDTTFPHAAWEDIEMAYRLTRAGMRIVYRPAAVARHYHDITFASFRKRQEKSGQAAAIFYAKHPELGDFLGVPQAILFRNGGTLDGRWWPFWAALTQKLRLPGGRYAVDHVLRQDYLRGLQGALPRGENIPLRGTR